MAVKLLMTWDIKQGREAEFFEFQVREWVPGLQKLGLEPTDAWYTMYGRSPQIMIGGTAKTLRAMNTILQSEEWEGLKSQLLNLVDNFDQKVIRASSGFQL
jgi:hypothetical protein